jgi:hypothetical protein
VRARSETEFIGHSGIVVFLQRDDAEYNRFAVLKTLDFAEIPLLDRRTAIFVRASRTTDHYTLVALGKAGFFKLLQLLVIFHSDVGVEFDIRAVEVINDLFRIIEPVEKGKVGAEKIVENVEGEVRFAMCAHDTLNGFLKTRPYG